MRELVRKWFDVGKNVFVLTVIPLIFTILFSLVYSLTYVEKIPLAVLDMDKSGLSRMIVQNFDDSPGFRVSMYVNSEAEMKEAFLRGEIRAGIVLPDNLEKDIKANRSPRVLALIDGSNIYIGNNVYSYAANILGTLNAGIQLNMLEAGGMTPFVAGQNLRALSLGERMLYAPQMGNFVFAFAGYLGVFIQQTFMTVLSPVLLREKKAAEIAKDWAVFGLLTVAALVSCLITAHLLGGYPLRGSIFTALLVHTVFILDITAVTIFIAAFFKDTSHCIQFILLLSIPTFMTSGYIWPEFVMPGAFAALIKVIWPLHYFVLPLRDIMLKGTGFWEAAHYIAGGLIFAAVWFPAALLVCKIKNALLRYNLPHTGHILLRILFTQCPERAWLLRLSGNRRRSPLRRSCLPYRILSRRFHRI